MGTCVQCNQTFCKSQEELDTDCKANPALNKLDKSRKSIHRSLRNLGADARKGEVVIGLEGDGKVKRPMRWPTYNPHKPKEKEYGKNMTEKAAGYEECKDNSVDKTDSNTGKANFVHFKTTIGIGRSQMVRSLNIERNSKNVPIITLDTSNLVLENKGKIKDTYKIMSTIGRGAFGEVHKIMHNQTKKYYAMKTINKANYEEDTDILNEIQILKSLVTYR
eukprot:TRINITY_DN1998_c0_g1_i11.p2 TRINITY_DN1998_c0_g1~~TRINITY_DN1998_c0_g1_i11.p2  ORF type:complete len:252 (-),score=71.08 TRINITY_DN1998_c0_g1_i11:1440-2099(-)